MLWMLLLTLAPVAAETNCGLRVPEPLVQGQLVRGQAPPGSKLRVLGRDLRLAADGRWVFGIGRDLKSVQLFVQTPAGCMSSLKLPVQARDWAIERVSGLPPQTVNPDPATARRIAQEGALITAAREHDSPLLDWQAALSWPARGRISGVYGSQRVLNGEPKSPHMGLDIAAPTGTVVLAPWDGTVRLVHREMVLTGGTLIIDHGFGVNTVYIHLSRIDVSEGQRVVAGTPIAAIGATGRASGPHLHFQLQWFQEKLDPARLLPSQ